ncbi:MAG: hypothetical protein AAB463_02625 [Patescibacteria group bacterium]
MSVPQQFGIVTDPDNQLFGLSCMISKVTPAGWCTVRMGNLEARLQEHTCLDTPDVPQVMRIASPENRATLIGRALRNMQVALRHLAAKTRNQDIPFAERQSARGEFMKILYSTTQSTR